jgi:hypothetical protein
VNLQEKSVRELYCPTCGAQPLEKCITLEGTRAHSTHRSRYTPLQEAWLDGFNQAREAVMTHG